MGEKNLIYVAGNPDAYPLEYYNPETEAYEGIIPRLLEKFSEESGYEILYYRADSTDHREEFAKNNQVDILSGYQKGEILPRRAGTAALFTTSLDGKPYTYQIYFTEAAPEAFCSELRTFLQNTTSEEITGILLESMESAPVSHGIYWMAGGLAAALLVLAVTVTIIVLHYRKKISFTQTHLEKDESTGIGNMRYLIHRWTEEIHDKNRILYELVYFYIDIDHLQRFSSNEEAEEFMRYCAGILREYTRPADILARVSEQGFVLLRMSDGKQQDCDWIHIVLNEIYTYTKIYQKPFDTHVHAAICPLRTEDRDLKENIFQAVQSAYAAKKEGKQYLFYAEQTIQKINHDRDLRLSLENAFLNHEFQLYIQFHVNTETGKIVGGEALSRWNHPQRGLLGPGDFVPLMEEEQMIDQLDFYSLKNSCYFLEHLAQEGIKDFRLSCNFSRETFAAPDFADHIAQITGDFSFPNDMLILELTESASAKDIEQIQKNILALRSIGFRIALDDFGVGFTSFYDLQKYAIDMIKLDKSLTDYMLTPTGGSILNSLVQVGHELGMKILVEGVETKEQAHTLKNMHCDLIQGFYFYHPLPHWEAIRLIMKEYRSSGQ